MVKNAWWHYEKEGEEVMDEITRVFTVEITFIEKGNTKKLIPKEKVKALMQKDLKEYLDADDVLVTNIQDFIREVKDNGND